MNSLFQIHLMYVNVSSRELTSNCAYCENRWTVATELFVLQVQHVDMHMPGSLSRTAHHCDYSESLLCSILEPLRSLETLILKSLISDL